jgi:hypothetical protein
MPLVISADCSVNFEMSGMSQAVKKTETIKIIGINLEDNFTFDIYILRLLTGFRFPRREFHFEVCLADGHPEKIMRRVYKIARTALQQRFHSCMTKTRESFQLFLKIIAINISGVTEQGACYACVPDQTSRSLVRVAYRFKAQASALATLSELE